QRERTTMRPSPTGPPRSPGPYRSAQQLSERRSWRHAPRRPWSSSTWSSSDEVGDEGTDTAADRAGSDTDPDGRTEQAVPLGLQEIDAGVGAVDAGVELAVIFLLRYRQVGQLGDQHVELGVDAATP